DTAHIAGYRYAAKIASAGFFDEILLFMDCCQDVLKSSQVLEPTWSPPDRNRSHKVKLLQAIGAPRGRKAFERDLDDNGIQRGLFTVVLLEALRTAIPDAKGWVNGYDLKKQFAQIWGKRFREETRYDPPVRIPDGEDIRILRRRRPPSRGGAMKPSGPDRTMIRIDSSKIGRLSLPRPRLHRQGKVFDYIKNFKIDSKVRNLPDLPAGVFTIETEGNHNDLAFEVLPSEGTQQVGRIEFHELPARSAAAREDRRFKVTVSGADAAMQLRVLDSDYNTLATGDGSAVVELAPGVYKAELTAGGATSQKIFRVVDSPVTVTPAVPRFPAAAPVPGTSNSDEYQAQAAHALATDAPLRSFSGADSELVIFIRASEPVRGSEIARPYPWEDLFLRNFAPGDQAWRITLDAVDDSRFFGGTKLAVPAGTYALCSATGSESDDEEFGFALRTVPGWRTEVYLDSILEPPDDAHPNGARARANFAQATVHLVTIGEASLVFDELGTHTELARIRLAAGRRSILPSDEHVARSPMLGLYCAYSVFQRDPNDRHKIERCLRALPAEVRTLTDARLLDAWLNLEAEAYQLQPLDIPLLTLAWDLSRRLPADRQLAPDLRGLVGLWRTGGSLWTSWRRPVAAYRDAADAVDPPAAAVVTYDSALAVSQRLADVSRQPDSLDPPWDMAYWRDLQPHLRTPLPGSSPFKQALRRRLLDAIAMEEDIVESEIFELGVQHDLDRSWTALEYREFHALHAPKTIAAGA
ncbi:MAG: hypothetical protein DWQ08_09155, partial [Proteobacteria bacterium]